MLQRDFCHVFNIERSSWFMPRDLFLPSAGWNNWWLWWILPLRGWTCWAGFIKALPCLWFRRSGFWFPFQFNGLVSSGIMVVRYENYSTVAIAYLHFMLPLEIAENKHHSRLSGRHQWNPQVTHVLATRDLE